MSRRKIDWSELYPELLTSISDRLQTRDDVLHFRSVCTKWRYSILQVPHNLPILSPIFPHYLSNAPPTLSCFGNSILIVANTTFLLQNPSPNPNSKPWLITVEESNPGKLFLRKPLVRTAIKGFPITLDFSRFRVREIRKDYNLSEVGGGSIPINSKVVLFFNPDCGFGTSVRDCYALVLHDQGNLFFVRLSDEDDCGYLRYSHASRFDDIVNYKGVIWAIDRKGRAYVIRYDRNNLRLRRFADDGVCAGYVGDTRKRLIESDEGLYLIDRYHYDELIKFRVYKLNEGEHKWSEVKNLDGRIIFVSSDCCFFGSAEYFPACEGNCILFPKDHFPSYCHITYPDDFYFKGADKVLEIGVFHLDDGESGLISTFPGFSDIFWPPPWWLFSDTCPSGRKPGQENDEDGPKVCEEMCSASLANETDVQAIGSPSTIISHEQCEGLNVSWSDIPSKLLTEIANHLKTRMDVSRFRSVCKKWRTSFPPHEGSSLLSSLLPHKISTTVAPFLDRAYKTPRSESLHSLILVVSTVYLLRPSDQSIGPSKSWLVTVEELNQGRLFLRLPLRRAVIQQLPNDFPRVLNLSGIRVSEISTEYNFRYPNDNWYMFRSDNWWSFSNSHKVVLSHGNPYTSPAIDDTTALVLYDKGNLITFRLRDERSSSIRCGTTSKFDDIISSNGKIFVIDRKGRAYVFNRNSSTVSRVVDRPLGSGHGPDRQKRLVESDGELYVVVRHSPDDQIFFRVYKMNERQNKWDEVKSLGDKILFVTHSFCFVASSRDLPGWKGNCVVFPEDCLPTNSGSTGHDWRFFRRTIKELRIAVFYLGDNDGAKLIKTYPGYSDLFWPPPSWLQLARCSSSSNKEMQIDLPCEPSDGGEISPDLLEQTAEEGQNLENSSTSVKQALYAKDEAKSETTPVVTSRVQSSDTGIVSTVEFQGVQVRPEFLPVLHKIWHKHGNLTEKIEVTNTESISDALESLAKAVLILRDTQGRHLDQSKADTLSCTLLKLQEMQFRVDWLIPFVEKALKCQKGKSLVDNLERIKKSKAHMQEIKRQMAEMERNTDDRLKLVMQLLKELGPIDLESCIGDGIC